MKPNTKKTILCLFDWGCNSGFANVSENLLSQLDAKNPNGYEYVIVAINYYGEPKKQGNKTILPASRIGTMTDPYGIAGFLKLLKDQPEITGYFIMQDLQVISPYKRLFDQVIMERKASANPIKGAFYFPVDSVLKPEWVSILEMVDYPITYTSYGVSEVEKCSPSIADSCRVIPHGANFKQYFPMNLTENKKKKLKSEYFGEQNADKYVFLSVNTNQPRKDFPTLLNAWKTFLLYNEGAEENAILYLHTNPTPHVALNEAACYDLKEIMRWLQIPENTVVFPKFKDGKADYTVKQLNEIYNCSDTFVTTTLGEGWGLTITQAFQTKLPVIAPKHTSIKEFANLMQTRYGSYGFVALSVFYPVFEQNVFSRPRKAVVYSNVATALSAHFRIKNDHRKNSIDIAYKFAQSLDWDLVGQKWVDIFKEVY